MAKVGVRTRGVPSGTKNEKNFNLYFVKANTVTPIKIVILKPNATMIDVVIVKL